MTRCMHLYTDLKEEQVKGEFMEEKIFTGVERKNWWGKWELFKEDLLIFMYRAQEFTVFVCSFLRVI